VPQSREDVFTHSERPHYFLCRYWSQRSYFWKGDVPLSSWLCLFAVCVTAPLTGSDDYLKGYQALSSARYGDAVKAFSACAAKEGPLAPYAELRKAFCLAASGDREAGANAYLNLIKAQPNGPWVRMAKTYLGSLLATQKDFGQATVLLADALDFAPKPWWVDRYDAVAADAFVQYPQTAPRGYAYYENVIAATRSRIARLDAAKHLAESADPKDKLVAAWGWTKSGECDKALDLLAAIAPDLLTGPTRDFDWKGYARALLPQKKAAVPDAPRGLDPVRDLVRDFRNNLWVREWLAYLARTQTAAGTTQTASVACELLLDAFHKSDETSEALWWLATRLAKDGKQAEAIEQFLRFTHEFPDNPRADDALLAVAELQRGLGKVKDLAKTAHTLAESYPESPLLPKAWYWVGCAEQKTDRQKSLEAFRRTATHGCGDYYAHRALVRLRTYKDTSLEMGRDIKVDGTSAFLKAFPLPSETPPAIPEEFLSTPALLRLSFFATHGMEEAEWEALDLASTLKGDPSARLLYPALAEAGLAFTAVNYADAFRWENPGNKPSIARRRLDYPRAYWPLVLEVSKENGLDPYLVLAVARQESTFRPALISSAGAVGLMQVMPATADLLAKGDPEVPRNTADNLENPLSSLRLGAHYLHHMLDRWQGNIAFALASYNAGPGNFAKWRKQFAKTDLETFIESIPFIETREYVKIVLANYAAYHSLYPPAD